MMHTHVLIYNGYVSFEIMLATYLMKTKGDIVTVGLSREPVRSYEDLVVMPSTSLEEINVAEIDLLIIPGGDTSALLEHTRLAALVQELDKQEKFIAAICSATDLLQHYGILEGRHAVTNAATHIEDLVRVDRNLITARANGYADFAIELGRMLNIYKDEADLEETIQYFKYHRNG
ncbi:DJ-1/PfpI family protein [Paenibacillus sp. FSL K6-1230]|uniref:DJ-1/PfpI family protein n=1 Tax=Paenibacillus sp. FSL K6-1230 TaxID=2921603 RepID=UPI0030F78668